MWLDLVWNVRRRALTAEVRRATELENPSQLQKIEQQLAPTHHGVSSVDDAVAAAELVVLRTWLRRWPTWSSGHARVAEIALVVDDLSTAYAAAQAVRTLRGGADTQGRALLARTYIRRGLFDEALDVLGTTEKQEDCVEERAECYFGLGRYAEAVRWFEKLPPSRRSAEVVIALEYARGKHYEGEHGGKIS